MSADDSTSSTSSTPEGAGPIYRRAVIVGVGLLGGSIGWALRNRQLAHEVVGVGRPGKPPLLAAAMGCIDRAESDLALAARDADLVICCAPVQQIPEHVLACSQVMNPEGFITDVGSTKLTIAQQIQQHSQRQQSNIAFIGSHPLAGGTSSGPEQARADLLEGSLVLVTPDSDTPLEIIARAEKLWQSLGARTICMPPQMHDQALAQTSHLPHIVAAALAASTAQDLVPLTATGWRSTTRIASGNAKLWRQILEENRLPALQALQNFAKVLEHWLAALEKGDGDALEQLLEQGKTTRDALGS
ncbi:MAG: prephenate dehydrogenase/arogenate dehydrogenase family protein [Pirellulaceae bacterium]|nr:prephenate dehydrogenase/arogenate dehydrogenase family protein [Pirellulaceae bacterium]